MKYLYKWFWIILLLSGCEKFLSVDVSPNIIEPNDIYTSEQNVLSATNGIYVQMRNSNRSFGNGALSIYLGLYTDELVHLSNNANYLLFYSNKLLSDNALVNSTFWNEPFHLIYRINSILKGVEEQNVLDVEFTNQTKGEMLFLRSFIYFYLTTIFGDVPLVLGTDYMENQSLGREAIDKIVERIVLDLESATELLQESYPSAGKVRPNKRVAQAFLARVYLEQGEWQKAFSLAEEIINSPTYILEADNLTNVFLINSSETIWEIASKNELANSAEGINFIPASTTAIPNLILSENFLQLFELHDRRFLSWTGFNEIGGRQYFYPYKYKNRSTVPPVTEYNVVLRLPEQYLIAADAALELGNKETALFYLNEIRKRAGLGKIKDEITIDNLRMELRDERQREFFAEWGHRWIDLKRTDLLDDYLMKNKPDWTQDASLFPIPLIQLNSNPNLTQNASY